MNWLGSYDPKMKDEEIRFGTIMRISSKKTAIILFLYYGKLTYKDLLGYPLLFLAEIWGMVGHVLWNYKEADDWVSWIFSEEKLEKVEVMLEKAMIKKLATAKRKELDYLSDNYNVFMGAARGQNESELEKAFIKRWTKFYPEGLE